MTENIIIERTEPGKVNVALGPGWLGPKLCEVEVSDEQAREAAEEILELIEEPEAPA